MNNIRIFSENFHFLVVKFSVYLYSHVFVTYADQGRPYMPKYSVISNDSVSEQQPSGHITFIQRRINVDATS